MRLQCSINVNFLITVQQRYSLTELIIIFETSRLTQSTHLLRNIGLSYWQRR
jgi:hypothetical protein